MCNRLFDVIVGSILLVITAPVVLFFGVIVAITSSGGSIFKQKRVGLNEKIFYIQKIRTMYINKKQLPAVPGDARITPIGSFIRKIKIDELPQLWNVVKGDMSIVGPRPKRLFIWNSYSVDSNLRSQILSIRPGMTGPSQVRRLQLNERYLHQNQESIFLWSCGLEIEYASNKHLIGDLCLCINTAWIIVKTSLSRMNFSNSWSDVPG